MLAGHEERAFHFFASGCWYNFVQSTGCFAAGLPYSSLKIKNCRFFWADGGNFSLICSPGFSRGNINKQVILLEMQIYSWIDHLISAKLFRVFIFKTKLASILSSTLRICRKSPSTLQFATWMHLVSRMGHHLSKLGELWGKQPLLLELSFVRKKSLYLQFNWRAIAERKVAFLWMLIISI